MNKEKTIKEVIDTLTTSNYVDTAEHLYDGLKRIKKEITLSTVHDFLWALECETVIDFDGKITECINKIKPLLDYMNNERYNQIINEAYKNYAWKTSMDVDGQFTKIEFINRCKTDLDFSERWGLLIKETYDLVPHTEDFGDVTITKPKRRNKLIVVYKNETIEVYE